MGVDAKILVRNKWKRLDETELRQVAANMCATIGHNKFFLQTDGKYGGQRHALSFCETIMAYEKEYNETAYGVAPSVNHSLQLWSQDGPSIIAEPGEQFIEAHLWTRYYGEGYERGDWPTIRATIEFLELAIPGCEVWYGGDSSGILAEHFDLAAREKLNCHYLTVGHQPYRGGFGMFNRKLPQQCAFCAGRQMNNTGGGGSDEFWSCDGCGLEAIVRADGSRYESRDLKEGMGLFEFAEKIRRGQVEPVAAA